MGINVDNTITASDYNSLKNRLDAELKRRGGQGSVYGYGNSSSYDATAVKDQDAVVSQ